MKESFQKNSFSIAKLICLVLLMAHRAVSVSYSLEQKALHLLLIAVFAAFCLGVEFVEAKRVKTIFLLAELLLCLLLFFVFYDTAPFLLVFTVLDCCSVFALSPLWYLAVYLIVFGFFDSFGGLEAGFFLVTMLTLAYYQEKHVISKIRQDIMLEETAQNELKTDLEKQSRIHAEEIRKKHLQFENSMLTERDRISQALHDKLGHSINGSLYQLEAAKLLIPKKPEESEKILQGVIDQLRQSMDEIRAILRKERPDKKRLALLSLQTLCEECESRYNIETELIVEDPDNKIPEKIWEIILDNTSEAITNALKYSEAKKLSISILTLNTLVRCTIKDDGKGCESVEDGMGLAGMKNRVRSVKGSMTVESEFGFTINMLLPI